jgi:hypothetical protein
MDMKIQNLALSVRQSFAEQIMAESSVEQTRWQEKLQIQ